MLQGDKLNRYNALYNRLTFLNKQELEELRQLAKENTSHLIIRKAGQP